MWFGIYTDFWAFSFKLHWFPASGRMSVEYEIQRVTHLLLSDNLIAGNGKYLQQLGRGMRKSEGEKFLMIFDFIDNTNMFNLPLSIHRMFKILFFSFHSNTIITQAYIAILFLNFSLLFISNTVTSIDNKL